MYEYMSDKISAYHSIYIIKNIKSISIQCFGKHAAKY